jgi:hypothetical protein
LVTSLFFLNGFDNVHVGLDGDLTLAEAEAGQMAAAEAALPYALRALHFPNTRLQTDARHVLFTLFAKKVIYVVLQFVLSHG